MASLDVIRSLTIRAKTEGFDKAKSDVEGLGTSYEDSARRQLSMAKSLEQLERRFVSGAREQQEFAKVQRQVNMILAQNPALQDRANKVLEEAHGRLSKATESTGGFNKALVAANDNLVGFASRLGTVGPLLVALGPAGIAASAALVALTLGLKGAADAALKLSETAGKLKDLSETTGFTVVQLQALE